MSRQGCNVLRRIRIGIPFMAVRETRSHLAGVLHRLTHHRLPSSMRPWTGQQFSTPAVAPLGEKSAQAVTVYIFADFIDEKIIHERRHINVFRIAVLRIVIFISIHHGFEGQYIIFNIRFLLRHNIVRIRLIILIFDALPGA